MTGQPEGSLTRHAAVLQRLLADLRVRPQADAPRLCCSGCLLILEFALRLMRLAAQHWKLQQLAGACCPSAAAVELVEARGKSCASRHQARGKARPMVEHMAAATHCSHGASRHAVAPAASPRLG